MSKTKKKIELSLTDFVDFVCKSGSTKLSKEKITQVLTLMESENHYI
ncbi:MAG: hypothetical protein ACXIUQ_18905 [Cecembia sp.]